MTRLRDDRDISARLRDAHKRREEAREQVAEWLAAELAAEQDIETLLDERLATLDDSR